MDVRLWKEIQQCFQAATATGSFKHFQKSDVGAYPSDRRAVMTADVDCSACAWQLQIQAAFVVLWTCFVAAPVALGCNIQLVSGDPGAVDKPPPSIHPRKVPKKNGMTRTDADKAGVAHVEHWQREKTAVGLPSRFAGC